MTLCKVNTWAPRTLQPLPSPLLQFCQVSTWKAGENAIKTWDETTDGIT